MRCLLFAIACSFLGTASLLAADHDKHDHSTMGRTAEAAKGPTFAQKTCPVSGKPISKSSFVEFEGQKVYFCCDNCPVKFKELPDKYLPALYRQIYPQTVQVKCPVMGDPIDGKTFIDFQGERVGFCCDECPPKFKANPGKYAAKLEAAFTDQVHDPVTGKAISPQVSVEYRGKTVYFNSPDAMKEFKAKPAKYADKLLPEVGVLARGATADDDVVLCAVAAPEKALHKRKDVQATVYQGKTWFLGSADDAKAFKASPDKYAKAVADQMKTRRDNSDHWFTCSMDPDVLQKGPGKCPKCGMDLIPVKSTDEKKEHPGHGMMDKPGGGRADMAGEGHGQGQQSGGHTGHQH